MTIRRRLLRKIIRNWFKIPEGNVLPWYVIALRCVVFPSTFLLIIQNKIGPVKYDFCANTFEICGIRYSAEIFESFGVMGMPTGSIFRLDKRDNGTILLTIIRKEGSDD